VILNTLAGGGGGVGLVGTLRIIPTQCSRCFLIKELARKDHSLRKMPSEPGSEKDIGW